MAITLDGLNKRPASSYWRSRFEQIEAASNKSAVETFETVQKQYLEAEKEIEKQISTWYQRFAKNNNITMAEARRLLTTKELAEFKWDVKEFIKYGEQNALNPQWMQELENASARFHVSRLEALRIETQHTVEKLFGGQIDAIDTLLKRNYLDSYYHTVYEIQKGFNIGWDIASIDQNKLEKIISKPWAADGKNFSERIWGNKSKLINELHTELTQMSILGKAPDDAIRNIAGKMNTSKNNAGKLVMTESAYFASASQKDAFNELDVERFEIVATLDSRTSVICQDLDGHIFEMKDYEPGVTAPPFHVYCRTTTVPYFEDNYGERAARDADGKTYYVPDKMNYKEWKESLVDGGSKDGLNELDKNGKIKDTKKEFKKASTIEEAKSYASKFADNVSFKGIKNLESLNEFNETLEGLTEKYPIEKLGNINTKNGNKYWGSANYRDVNLYSSFTNDPKKTVKSSTLDWKANNNASIEKYKGLLEKAQSDLLLDPESYYKKQQIKSIEKVIKEYEKRNQWARHNVVYEDLEVRSVFTHEYGHVLADQYFQQINYRSMKYTDDMTKKRQLVRDAFNKAKQSGDIYKISMYANKDAAEFFAEAFAMRELGIETLPDYIEEMFKGVLGK